MMDIKVGQLVRYAYHVGAMSACQNGKVISGEGRIDEIRPAGRGPNIGVGRVWLFPREIKATWSETDPAQDHRLAVG